MVRYFLVDVFEPLLINNTIATRIGKGTHIGIKKVKECLKYCLKEINKIVADYKLELNNKTRIYHIDEGFEFLGFKYIKKNNKLIVKVKNQTKKKFKRKMKNMYKLYTSGRIEIDKLVQVKMSYLGHLKYSNVIMCE